MRKALKELRYQAEFFAPLLEKPVTRRRGCLK
jgi:CHAD domain-containing protein